MCQYVVLDVEMCKVPKGCRKYFPRGREIIQMGAALVDEQLNIVDEFNAFVKPQYGKLDGFITNLTGIGSAELAGAEDFGKTLERFLQWMPTDSCIVSWSFTDRKQLMDEAELKGFEYDRLAILRESWIDAQKIFAEKVENECRNYSLQEALLATDIVSEGREHDGLSDAVNTASLFIKMMKEPRLVLNPLYEYAKSEESETLTFCLGDAFAKALAQAV